ncbi:MAG: cytochrome C oxidase subunit IV family protein [Novosphingobium sp.]
MAKLLSDRLLRTWALLVAVTLFSSQIGGAGGAARLGSAALVSVLVLGIAFAKAAMVMFTFMDLRRAPLALRMAAVVWLAAALGALLAIYFGLIG